MSQRQHTHSNQVLAGLRLDDFLRLEPHLHAFPLPVRQNIEQPDQAIRQVVFPTSGMVSVVAHEGEYQLEVGIIGREGMTGVALLLGADTTPQESFVQIAGQGVAIETGEFKRALADRPSLHNALLRYAHALMLQTAQTALANGRLTIEERLARWLLMCGDRLGTDQIPLTHEFLSIMLGVRRPGVTVALQVLEGEGAIRNDRGLITILKRAKLAKLAGGAYRPLVMVH
jgi:CRP-like cAMP-binding protein